MRNGIIEEYNKRKHFEVKKMKIAHLGHSTIYLELADDTKIIIDPYIDANLPECGKPII